jgi:hypothetical protein
MCCDIDDGATCAVVGAVLRICCDNDVVVVDVVAVVVDDDDDDEVGNTGNTGSTGRGGNTIAGLTVGTAAGAAIEPDASSAGVLEFEVVAEIATSLLALL